MKKLLPSIAASFVLFGIFSCKNTYVVHHSVRMVDAKSFMDHPMSASLFYYK